MTPSAPILVSVDPFDLPEWLGECDVTWSADSGLRTGYAVPGQLHASSYDPLPCDLLAIDVAYPRPVADDQIRHDAHQSWRYGQILLVNADDRLTLAVPGVAFTADVVLDAVSRLAKAVGASPEHYSVQLRIGVERR